MSPIDGLLLAAIFALAVWRVIAPGRGHAVAGLTAGVLAIIQLALEGVYWQFLPAYPLLLLAALTPLGRGRLATGFSRVTLVGLILAAAAPWAILPVPVLPTPDGRYGVGTQTFRWQDASRPETATPDPADRRNVVAQAWYPISRDAEGETSAYIDGQADLPPSIAGLPRFLMRHYDRIDTHAVVGATVSADRAKWPVVLFSPGWGAPRSAYTGLAGALASRGYVVVTIDHPYEAAVTQLADGRVVTTQPHEGDGRTYMADQQAIRAADLRFVLDQLGRPEILGDRLAGRLDLDHVAAIGHSLGGATAAAAMDGDPRIRAAANIDGTLYGDLPAHSLRGPFLLLDSDHGESGRSPNNLTDNTRLLTHVTGGAWRYEIKRANHFSFTDAPMFLSPPGRFGLSLLIGGARGPVATQQATADLLDAFLSGPLKGAPADIRTAAGRYDGIVGGPVR